jgi:polysaccharide deacetylase 2 family uncharacterized protein YibQ
MKLRLLLAIISLTVISVGGGWLFFTKGTHRTVVALLHSLKKNAPAPHTTSSRSVLENNILSRLAELEIPKSAVTIRTLGPDSVKEIRSNIPQGRPLEWIVWHLSRAIEGTQWRVGDCFCSPDAQKCTIRFTLSSRREKVLVLSLRRTSRYFSGSAKLAIMITDFSFAADRSTVAFLSFPHPLTMAILPSPTLSTPTATISGEYKKEIVALLPMEGADCSPHYRRAPMIMVHYPEERVRSIISDAAAAVPSFSGFSNIGGTRVLADSRITDILFSEIRKKCGYFIERPATKKSLCASQARRYSVATALIDHCIDTAQSAVAIGEALLRYGEEARKRGVCLVSCAPAEKLLGALETALPELTRVGVALVYVSELLTDAAQDKKQ